MNFKEATDRLLSVVTLQQLADTLGMHITSIGKARLDAEAKSYRTPPPGWEKAVIKLAEQHSKELAGLAQKLRAQLD